MALQERTLTPLGVFGLYVLGHAWCRDRTWNLQRGYVPKDEATIQPGFVFEEAGNLSEALKAHLSQNAPA